MGWEVETTSEPIARKNYRCDACDWIHDSINQGIFSFAEYRLIAKARRDNWQIKKDQRYLKVSGKWDGDWSTFRARPEMHDLCVEHEIYQE